jgi:hypothetical protein
VQERPEFPTCLWKNRLLTIVFSRGFPEPVGAPVELSAPSGCRSRQELSSGVRRAYPEEEETIVGRSCYNPPGWLQTAGVRCPDTTLLLETLSEKA